MPDNVECLKEFEENFAAMENAFALFLKGTEVMGGSMCTVMVLIIHPTSLNNFFPSESSATVLSIKAFDPSPSYIYCLIAIFSYNPPRILPYKDFLYNSK